MTSSNATDDASEFDTEVLPPESGSEAPAESNSALEEARAEAAKYRDLYLRGQADFDNFRKRAAREKEDAVRYSNSSLLERLLPILDNFELGLDAARQATDANGIILGMSMVQKQLGDFLSDSGLEIVSAEGVKFDPNLHEAVGQEASDSVPEGVVVRQLRRGFKLRDRLLRPASVIVSKGAA